MNLPTTTTRLATTSELDQVTALCIAAFADEAVITWVLPDPTTRRSAMRSMFDTALFAAVEAEALLLAVSAADEPIGASIWIPRTGRSGEAAPQSGDDPVARRLSAVHDATEARRPGTAHLSLSSMAVLPDHRGQGAGGAMVASGTARAGDLGLPVYLEVSTPQNRALYARHGFRDHGAPIRLPEQGPTLQPMWRDRGGSAPAPPTV